ISAGDVAAREHDTPRMATGDRDRRGPVDEGAIPELAEFVPAPTECAAVTRDCTGMDSTGRDVDEPLPSGHRRRRGPVRRGTITELANGVAAPACLLSVQVHADDSET